MKYIFDLCLIAIILIFALIGKRAGFVRTILNMVKGVVAAILSWFAGKFAAEFLFDQVIRQNLVKKFTESISNGMNTGESAAVWNSLPRILRNALENTGISQENILKNVTGGSEALANAAADAVKSVTVSLLSLVLSLIFFFILLFLLSIIIKAICSIFKLPVLNTINSFAGFIFGLLLGIFFVLLLCKYLGVIVLPLPEETASKILNAADYSFIYIFFHNLF